MWHLLLYSLNPFVYWQSYLWALFHAWALIRQVACIILYSVGYSFAQIIFIKLSSIVRSFENILSCIYKIDSLIIDWLIFIFSGMQSEYQGKYTKQTYYDSYPLIHSTLEDYDESLPGAGPWQTLTVPGMYCTDYCHIGTGWPVRAVIEPKKPEKCFERDIDLCRNEALANEACYCAD